MKFRIKISLAMPQETMHPTLHAGEFSELNETEYRYGKLWKKKSGNNEQHTHTVLFDNIINTFFHGQTK